MRGRAWTTCSRSARGRGVAEGDQLRLVLGRAGVPEPDLNVDIHALWSFVARVDLAYPGCASPSSMIGQAMQTTRRSSARR